MHRVRNNKPSLLLSNEENLRLFSIIGSKCESLATTVAEIWQVTYDWERQWKLIHMGVLCFIRDSSKKSYFLKLYGITSNTCLWEQEIYHTMEYLIPKRFLHIFEGEDYVVGLNFADEGEADFFRRIVQNTLARIGKQEGRNLIHTMVKGLQNTNLISKKADTDTIKKKKEKKNTFKNTLGRRKKRPRPEISKPQNFWHVAHATSDKDKSFDYSGLTLNDPNMKTFLYDAGLSQHDFEDKEKMEFICDFIKKNGGKEAVRQHSQRYEKTDFPNYIPRVKPIMNKQPAEDIRVDSPIYEKVDHVYDRILELKEEPSPPMPSFPPPPPPPPIFNEKCHDSMNNSLIETMGSDENHDITEMANENNPTMSSNILKEIRDGVCLKPVRKKNSLKGVEAPPPKQDLAQALRMALDKRAKDIFGDSDEEDEMKKIQVSQEHDEWDD